MYYAVKEGYLDILIVQFLLKINMKKYPFENLVNVVVFNLVK